MAIEFVDVTYSPAGKMVERLSVTLHHLVATLMLARTAQHLMARGSPYAENRDGWIQKSVQPSSWMEMATPA